MTDQLDLLTVSMPRAQFPPQIKDQEWYFYYTDDITTCAGVRTRTYEHLGQTAFKAGNRGLADILASKAYQLGVGELDRLEREGDLEGMKQYGRMWLKELTAICRQS